MWLFVLFVIEAVFGCDWQLIYDDTACYTGDSYGQRYTLTGCLAKCEREEAEYCTFAPGFVPELLFGCGTTPNCCVGSDQCAVKISDISVVTHQCIPTPTPTKMPTVPSIPPTFLPTFNPSSSPTANPTTSPTMNPSYNPSSSPTSDPSSYPTTIPTISPTLMPTISPSNGPSALPSISPSREPSVPPSKSPSFPPSRYPTMDFHSVFNSYIDAVYVLDNVSTEHANNFENSPTEYASKIVDVLQWNYYIADTIDFQDFVINIDQINGFDNISHQFFLKKEPIFIHSQIWSNHTFIGALLKASKGNSFKNNTRKDLMQYVFKNNTNLFFDVTELTLHVPDTIYPAYAYASEPGSTVYMIAIPLIIIGFGTFWSIIILISNKIDGIRSITISTDDANWMAVLLYAIQVYDVVTDILFSYDVFSNPDRGSWRSGIFWCGVLSVTFIVIPFICNVFAAVRMSQQEIVKNNSFADTYFNADKPWLFIGLVVLSASCHPSLILVSSGLYSLDAFNSGLSTFELNQLSAIKFKWNICAEDIPQLCIQIAYVVLIDDITAASVLAFTGSLLSIIFGIAVFCGPTKSMMKNGQFLQYYVVFEKDPSSDNLPDSEMKSIEIQRCKTKPLKTRFSGIVGTSERNMEIGYVSHPTPTVRIYVSHYISNDAVQDKVIYLKKIRTVFLQSIHVFYEHFGVQTRCFGVDVVWKKTESALIESEQQQLIKPLTENDDSHSSSPNWNTNPVPNGHDDTD